MLRGFYTAASGMITQQRRQEMITNNVANVNTPGYKADQIAMRSFPEMLIQAMNSKKLPTVYGLSHKTSYPVGMLNTGVYTQEIIPNFEQGSLRETGMYTDMAIANVSLPDETGGLFFTVQNENGDIRYTRNGNFTIDGQGYLTTSEGYYVLDANNNRIFTDTYEFVVTTEGDIQLAGQTIPLGIAYIADTNQLTKEGNGLFNPEQGNAIAVQANASGAVYSIRQNFLEGSNVDIGQAMTDMIQAYRNFEMNQRVLRAYDESMGKAVNDIARLG